MIERQVPPTVFGGSPYNCDWCGEPALWVAEMEYQGEYWQAKPKSVLKICDKDWHNCAHWAPLFRQKILGVYFAVKWYEGQTGEVWASNE